ncbi:hypothetical protein [Demequina aurantiaca]|uniref:hypothetical protein n=1 Tax=Demequina aurantiaca TaxID=676200 RepID=UPI000783E662|nr:hypothetical protein [Demequina aurantiaca]
MIARTIISAISIVLGALLVATWAVSQVAVTAVEDGSAVDSIAAAVFDSPEAVGDMSDDLGDAAVDAISDNGINIEALGLDGPIRDQVTSLVQSDEFATEVQRQVADSHEQFADALTDEARAPGPMILMLDVSPMVNDRLDQVPVVGSLIPDLTLDPIPVEVVSTEVTEDARTAFGFMEFAAAWFLWAGIALMVLGLLISARKRWFISKTLLAVGVLSLGVWALLTFTSPQTIASWFPGGEDSSVGTIVVQTFTAEAAPPIASRMLWWAIISLAGSAIFALVAAGMRRKKA